jgi:hypothetical protein
MQEKNRKTAKIAPQGAIARQMRHGGIGKAGLDGND